MSNNERTIGLDTLDYTVTAAIGFMVGNVAETKITDGVSQQNKTIKQQISTLHTRISGLEEAAGVVHTPTDHDAIVGRIENSNTQLLTYQAEHTQLEGQLGHEYGGVVSIAVGLSLLLVGTKKAISRARQNRRNNKPPIKNITREIVPV